MYHSYIEVGFLIKSFGKNGALRLNIFDSYEQDVQKAGYLIAAVEGNFIPLLIRRLHLKESVVEFRNHDGPEQVKFLSEAKVYLLDKDIAIQNVPTVQPQTLENFTLYDQNENRIGEVIEVIEMPKQILLKIHDHSIPDVEYFIPFHEDLLINLDPGSQIIQLEIAEGLVDIYKGES